MRVIWETNDIKPGRRLKTAEETYLIAYRAMPGDTLSYGLVTLSNHQFMEYGSREAVADKLNELHGALPVEYIL